MENSRIIIVGAGAAGLIAARELSREGKEVIILEARDRIGGRIFPLDEVEFGYPAQGGAEYAHGECPITKSLAKEAGFSLIRTQGDMWNSENGYLTINNELVPGQEILHKKLEELEEDLPFTKFLELYFFEDNYKNLRKSVIRMIEGYDAADPNTISTFALRDEWLGGGEWLQYRIPEGYGKLLKFLESECLKNGVKIYLGKEVLRIEHTGAVKAICIDQNVYEGDKIIVTAPVSVIKNIKFEPAIPEKIKAAEGIGFGGVIKLLYLFKERWWIDKFGKDFGEMDFLFTNEIVSIWWTQYPALTPLLTGWLAGPKTKDHKDKSDEELLEIGLGSLSNIFKTEKSFIKDRLVASKAVNWPADKFSRGAYSYWNVGSENAYLELLKPVSDKIFFAGEACREEDSATVEGALASGKEVAERIIKS